MKIKPGVFEGREKGSTDENGSEVDEDVHEATSLEVSSPRLPITLKNVGENVTENLASVSVRLLHSLFPNSFQYYYQYY